MIFRRMAMAVLRFWEALRRLFQRQEEPALPETPNGNGPEDPYSYVGAPRKPAPSSLSAAVAVALEE